jgi:hypothetical protein
MTEVDPGVIRRLADMHAVYRMFDHAGRLLYIGMTGQAGQRFGSHSQKVWFPLVSMITLEWHTTHAEAYLAETRAIAAERPRYNVAGTPKLAARRGRGQQPAARAAAKPAAPPPDRNVLGDVLKVFGDARGLHWQTIADRLAAQFPERWADVSKGAISAQARALGVPSVNVRYPTAGDGKVLQGCRRADVEVAAANQILGEACGRS